MLKMVRESLGQAAYIARMILIIFWVPSIATFLPGLL